MHGNDWPPPAFILPILVVFHAGAIHQIFPFAGYKKMYQNIEKYDKKQKTLIKSQSQTIKYIEKIFKN